jgi:uncharacterized protein YhaN
VNVRPRVTFDWIDIRRMYGIDPGFVVDRLCPGINVISGPNASGKTTLTHALLTLLWPSSPYSRQAVLRGSFGFDSSRWLVEYDNDARRCQRDGNDADHPVGAGDRDRYLLALHDLLVADNHTFAEAILRESAGGYDVADAMEALNLTSRPRAPQGLKGQLDQATRERLDALAFQQRLLQDERDLDGLAQELEEARRAALLVETLEKAFECHRARLAQDDALARLESFPAVLESMSGMEQDTLRELRARRQEALDAIAAETQRMADAIDQQARADLDDGVPGGLIATLRERCATLRDLASDARAAEVRRADAIADVATARRALGPLADDSRLERLDAVGFSQLAGIAASHATARAQLAALDALQRWLGPSVSDHEGVSDERTRLEEGIRALDQWLRHERATPVAGDTAQRGRTLLVAGVAVIVQAVVLGIVAHPAALILALTGAWLLYAGRQSARRASATRTSDPMPFRAEYERLGLETPATWDAAQVERLLESLQQRQRALALDDEKRQRWSHVPVEREALQSRVASLEADIDAMAEHYGAAPGTDPASLFILASNLVQWQKAQTLVAAIDADVEHRQATANATLGQINGALEPFGYEPSADVTDALGCVDDLARREHDWNEATASRERSQRLLREQLRPQVSRWEADLRTFFERLGLDEEDEHRLPGLLERMEDYRQAREAAERARLECERAERVMGDDRWLADLTEADIEQRLRDAQDLSAGMEEIRDEIASISARIEDARTRHDLERALSVERSRREALVDAREQAYAQVAGWSFGELIREETRDNDRPQVFHRARELFIQITHGRYRLELSDGDPPAFRAIDTISGAGHGLNELSSGTRLQLLLAVRVAFVEHQEQGIMLPLVFDETLGNSDEQRARAIIDATVEIARAGRQVLYLTAQHDEVRKWQAVMADHPEIPFRFHDLAEIRNLAEWERVPPVDIAEWPVPVIPAPNGMSRDDYRDLLRVPGIDPFASDTGGVHLWHLIEDTSTLHGLLVRHIETWGQLRAMAELGPTALGESQRQILRTCRARAAVIEAACACFRAGQGRPVDRAVIIESGAISSTFLDRVSTLAERVNGDAAALLKRLEWGEIPRFRAEMREALREYLEENDYLASGEPMTLEQAYAYVTEATAPHISEGNVTDAFIRETLAALWSEPAAGRHASRAVEMRQEPNDD